MMLLIDNMTDGKSVVLIMQILSDLGLDPEAVSIGRAELNVSPDAAQFEHLQDVLKSKGFSCSIAREG